MTLNGVITADPRRLCGSWASCLALLTIHHVYIRDRPKTDFTFSAVNENGAENEFSFWARNRNETENQPSFSAENENEA